VSVQKRPLSGMVLASGAAVPVAVGVAVKVLHTFGSVATQQGGPFVDQVSVWLNNFDNAPHDVVLAFGGPTPSALGTFTIPAQTTIQALFDVPFASARDAAATTLTAVTSINNRVAAWGWFAEVL